VNLAARKSPTALPEAQKRPSLGVKKKGDPEELSPNFGLTIHSYHPTSSMSDFQPVISFRTPKNTLLTVIKAGEFVTNLVAPNMQVHQCLHRYLQGTERLVDDFSE